MSREGWFCPTCQAFHGPHIDTCEIARPPKTFACNICGERSDKPVRCDDEGCMTLLLVNGVASRELH